MNRRARGSTAPVTIAAILLLGLSIYVHLRYGNGGDKNWRLLATHLWLSGRTLYHGTYFDVNPPLIVWLYSLPVRLADMLGLTDYHVLVATGFAFAAWATFLSLALLRCHPLFSGLESRRALLPLFSFIAVIYPNSSWFFEREYIFAVLTLPYLLRWLPGLAAAPLPLSLRIQTGLLAALGFCIKPHTAVLFAGIQLMVLVQRKSPRILWSLENIIIYAAALVYGGCVTAITPDYIHIVLPMARVTYRALEDYFDGLLYAIPALLTFAVTFVDFRPRHRSPYRGDIYYMLGLCPFLVLYIIANNGWFATYYPLMTLLFLLAAWVRWDALYLVDEAEAMGAPAKNFRFSARACAFVLLINALLVLPRLYAAAAYDCDAHIECRLDRMLPKEIIIQGKARSFGTFSSVFGRWLELQRDTGAALATRFHHLWMIPRFEIADAEYYAKQEWILRYVAEAYGEDIEARKPEVMFVDDNDYLLEGGRQVALPAYFSRYPAFARAWAGYRLDHTLDYCPPSMKDKPGCRFDVWLRLAP